MNCKGRFIFRYIEKKEAGSFTDENGKEIRYDSSFNLKLDEIVDGKPVERKFKIPLSDKNLANDFFNLKPYYPCEVTFDINIYANSVKLTPKQVLAVGDDKK